MTRFAHMVVLAAFLAVGFGVPMTFANEPAPAEQIEQKSQQGEEGYDQRQGRQREEEGREEGYGRLVSLSSGHNRCYAPAAPRQTTATALRVCRVDPAVLVAPCSSPLALPHT